MDGDQPGEGVVGKAQPLDEEVELGGPASVLHGVAQLPPAQHVDVALPEEGVCKDRKEKVGGFRKAVVVSNPFCLCTRCFHHPLCQSFSSAGGGETSSVRTILTQLRCLHFCICAQDGWAKRLRAFSGLEPALQRCFHEVSALEAPQTSHGVAMPQIPLLMDLIPRLNVLNGTFLGWMSPRE